MLAASADQSAGGGSRWPGVAFGVVFIAINLVNAVNPKLRWQMSKWALKNPAASEPSEAGLRMTRIVSSVLALVGVGIVIWSLTR